MHPPCPFPGKSGLGSSAPALLNSGLESQRAGSPSRVCKAGPRVLRDRCRARPEPVVPQVSRVTITTRERRGQSLSQKFKPDTTGPIQ